VYVPNNNNKVHLILNNSPLIGNILHLELLSTIKDWDLLHQRHFGVVFARLLCSAGITNENEFQFSGSPTPRVSNDITFGHTHTLFCNMASLVNPLDGDNCQNAAT